MATSEPAWTFLVPGDPGQRTGGYGYVREIVSGLQRLGQPVRLAGLAGRFPRVDGQAREALDEALTVLPDGATAIVDGLALGGCPEVAEQHSQRLNLVALVHHPLADETGLDTETRHHFFDTERRALAAVRGIVTTSRTTAAGLSRYGVPVARIATVPPGVHVPHPEVAPTPAPGGRLRILCLAHLSPRKAQHHLVEALARLPGAGWQCELAGSTTRDPSYADHVRAQVERWALGDRISLTGERSGEELERSFRQANLFVLPSLYEGYGMVIDEALAHGLPVVSSDGGALAATADRPGCVLYPAGNAQALADLLQQRLEDPDLLDRQQQAARGSAGRLRRWPQAAREFRQAIDRSLPSGSDFDARWLALREPADHAARSVTLTQQALTWLTSPHRPAPHNTHTTRNTHGIHNYGAPVIADIGAGTGSNWRYLSRALAAAGMDKARWHVFDQDADLLDHLPPEPSGPAVHIGRLESDNLDQQLPRPLDLVTASALIDLVSPAWLDAFTRAAASRRAAVLVVLSYAGHFRLAPDHRADGELRQLVNQHQHGDKGTGGACGPEASEHLAGLLEGHGYMVSLAHSCWHLEQHQTELQKALMQGWVDAARAQLDSGNNGVPSSGAWLEQWLADRTGQADRGELVIEVDHIDLLGVPSSC